MRFGIGACQTDNGPVSPVVYDTGDAAHIRNLYGPQARGMRISQTYYSIGFNIFLKIFQDLFFYSLL